MIQRTSEPARTLRPAHESSPPRRAAAAPAVRRSRRYSFPLPRREACLTRRAMRAALREAEFHEWLNGGADCTEAMHQPAP